MQRSLDIECYEILSRDVLLLTGFYLPLCAHVRLKCRTKLKGVRFVVKIYWKKASGHRLSNGS